VSCTETMMTSKHVKGCFGVGTAVTKEDAEITGSRLPSNKQVLRSYLYFRANPSEKNQRKVDYAKMVLNQVMQFYSKANIPTITYKIVKPISLP